jgi:biopolymer transport protein ExbB/TolQ
MSTSTRAALAALLMIVALPAAAAEPTTLERAYLKELALLKAQKGELDQRLAEGAREDQRVLGAAQAELDSLRAKLLRVRASAETAEESLRGAPESRADKIDVVYSALEQASAVAGLREGSVATLPADRVPTDEELGTALSQALAAVVDALDAARTVRAAPGTYYSADGKQLEGTVVHVGRIAAYGVSTEAAGALVPAGQGQLELVPLPAEAQARELAAGRVPAELPLFFVESLDELLLAGKETNTTKEVEAVKSAGAMQGHGIVGTLMSLPIFEAEWVLYLLIIMSIVSVAVMVERALFFRKHAIDIDSVRTQVKTFLDRGDFAGAAGYLSKYDSLETNVVLFGLREHQAGPDSVEDLLRGAEAKEKLRYGKWLSFLATVGSNSPFIGLFGTVLGIIRAFGDMANESGGAGTSVMAGISEALIATAVGLLVAIPAVIAYNAFMGKVKTVMANSELLSRTFLSALKSHDVPGAPAQAS